VEVSVGIDVRVGGGGIRRHKMYKRKSIKIEDNKLYFLFYFLISILFSIYFLIFELGIRN